jgi:hypothetical protein
MDTLSFLRKILPERGVYFIAKWVDIADHPRGGVMLHDPFGEDQLEEMAQRALRLSDKGANIYFACGSFKEVQYRTNKKGKDYPVGRTQSNTMLLRSFWLDIDVGKADPSKCWPSQKDAVTAVAKLCKATGLPMPMIVSSGAGVHCYWTLTAALQPEPWRRVAGLLRAACEHLEVRDDTSRTTDCSSVLRIVGTTHHKHGRPVRLMRDADPISVGTFAKTLVEYAKANHLKPAVAEPKPKAEGMAAAILGNIEYPAYSAKKAAEHCAFLANFRDVVGNVNEPSWYYVLGILKSSTEGEALAHEWSRGHPQYSESDTQAKLDQWEGGPPYCETIKRVAGGEHCAQCQLKCASPAMLGRELTAEVVAPAAPAQTQAAPLIPFCPAGFRWTGKAMVQQVPDRDGILQDRAFSDTLFFATNRIRGSDGTWNLRIRMSVAGHEWRDFDLPTTLVADKHGFAKHMAKYEVLIFNVQPAQQYMNDILNLLMQYQQQQVTYDRFGWYGGKFVVGKTAFLPDGSTEEVLTTGNINKTEKNIDCTPKGDLARWTELIDIAYNRPGAEKYQFIIAAAFASPLIALADFENFRGMSVVLSGEGGVGKSSAVMAAGTIYAPPRLIKTNGDKEHGATLQSIIAVASMFNGLPLLIDEITNREHKDFTPIMYSLSNGVGKLRLTSSGQFAETAPPFTGISFGTSNISVTDALYDDEKKSVSDATSARCFEIGGLTKADNDSTFAGVHMQHLLEEELFKHHHGVAAQVYLPYVINRKASVVRVLAEMRKKLGSDMKADSRERYYIDTIAFAHVAASIASRLGLIRWDVKNMTKWAIRHLKNLRRSFADRNAMVDDISGAFLSWLHSNTIVTKHFPSGRSPAMEVANGTYRHKPMARIATVDRKFIVTIHALTEWCKEYKQDYTEVRDRLRWEGYIMVERLEYIGKGTQVHAGRSRCFELNYDKVVGSLHAVPGIEETPVTTAAVAQSQ